MEQELQSIITFIHKASGINNIETNEVLEGINKPLLYFPQIDILSFGGTTHTFMNTYSWYIKIFAETSEEAHSKCLELLQLINKKRQNIQLLNKDGSITGEYVRLKNVSVSKIDIGISQLAIVWDSFYKYDTESAQKAVKFFIDYKLKEVI